MKRRLTSNMRWLYNKKRILRAKRRGQSYKIGSYTYRRRFNPFTNKYEYIGRK